MAQPDLPPSLMPSLKDRLFDAESMGDSGRPEYGLHQILDSVRDDLDDLLNSRRPPRLEESHYPELARSIVAYGLPDITSANTQAKQEAFGRVIEKIITTYESRLRNVRVSLVRARALELRVLFHIDAELRVDPSPEVVFETVVELTTGHATVSEATG